VKATRFYLNGEPRTLPAGATVDDVVVMIVPGRQGCAVARNGEVVPRSSWATVPLEAEDRIELLGAAPGG
jgi:sulfur carrier protein